MAISVTSPCHESTVQELGINNWPIWTCEASSFDWTYSDKEICLLLDGDLVVFPGSMNCRWDVHKAVRKHYRFGD